MVGYSPQNKLILILNLHLKGPFHIKVVLSPCLRLRKLQFKVVTCDAEQFYAKVLCAPERVYSFMARNNRTYKKFIQLSVTGRLF